MPAGFYTEGDHGIVQIDENYKNMVLVQKGYMYMNNNTYGAKYSVSYTGETPMMFIRPTSLLITVAAVRRSGNTWTWTYFSTTTGAENIEYYIFDRQPNTETRAGLNVYNADGNVTFNSDYRPMVMAAAVPTPFGYQVADTNQFIGYSKYAVMQPTPGFNARLISSTMGFYTFQAFRLNSGNTLFATGYSGGYSQQGPPGNGGCNGGISLVIDVSRIPW